MIFIFTVKTRKIFLITSILSIQHGALLALAYILNSRKDLECGMSEFKESTQLFLKNLSPNVHTLMISGACFALGEVGRRHALPISDDGEEMSKKFLYERLLEITNSNKLHMKIRERAAIALGQLCIGDMNFPWRHNILTGFLQSAKEIKDIELHFTIGEGLVFATLGPLSSNGRDVWREDKDGYRNSNVDVSTSDKEIKYVLDELVDKYTLSNHPNEKQASCIWLLALVKEAKDHHLIKERLMEIQSAFMGLLGDSNDLVQDAASKGTTILKLRKLI